MSEDQLETPVSEPVLAPTATVEPVPEAVVPTEGSEVVEGPPENTGGPGEAEGVVVDTIDNVGIEPIEPKPSALEQAAWAETGGEKQPVLETSTAPTAQIPVFEPLGLLAKAREMIQFRKRKKLNRIMELLSKKGKVVSRDVQLLLHVSDATATRYLEQLEKEGKIKQNGKTGAGVSYTRLVQ